MPYLGGGEGGRKASIRETNQFKQGRSGSKVPILPGNVKRVHQNATKSGGINRATRSSGGSTY